MIIDYETKETINNFVNEHVPKGIHKQYYVDCRKQIIDIIEAFIEADIMNNDAVSIETVCLNWEELICKKVCLLN